MYRFQLYLKEARVGQPNATSYYVNGTALVNSAVTKADDWQQTGAPG